MNERTPLGIRSLSEFSVDSSGKLFWKNKEVKTKQRLSFTFWQGLFAILAALGTFLSGIVDLIQLVKGW